MAAPSAAQLPSSSSKFGHVGPNSLHVITTAASLHLDDFLRRRIHHPGFLLPSPSFNVKHVYYLGHLHCLRDIWHEAIPYKGSNMLQWSFDAISGTFMSLYFASGNSGEGNRSDPSHGGNSVSRFISKERTWSEFLLGANVAVFVAQKLTQGRLLLWGAKINSLIDKGQVWRLVTSSFLHLNLLHLLINSLSLSNIGPAVENFSGPRRFLAVYFTSAVTSSAMSYLFCKSASVGASGAIFGLIGANTVFLLRHKDIIVDADQHLKLVMRVLAINVVLGITLKGIDNWGHLGGFLGGVATSWLLGPALKWDGNISSDGRKQLMDKPPISAVWKPKRPAE